MSKARRMKDSENKCIPKISKHFLMLLILVVIVFFTLFYLNKTNKITFLSDFFNNIGFKTEEILDKDTGYKLTNISEQAKVINTDVLVANNLEISQSSDNKFEILTTLQNNSKKKIMKLKISLHIYDSKISKLGSFDFTVDKILSKSKSALYTISNTDLSNASYYCLVLDE